MKVVFLDHDGVVCLDRQWGSRFEKQKMYTRENRPALKKIPVLDRFDDFDQNCVESLNRIIDITDCEIVVSSDWRSWSTVEEMQEYYLSQGVKKGPIGFTPFIYTNEVSGVREARHHDKVLECIRSAEIKKWLADNPVSSWVAIDDMDLSYGLDGLDGLWGLENFVLSWSLNEGLSNQQVEQDLINLVNKPCLV